MAYVYAIPVEGIVRYIGKGTGQRLHQHLKIVRSIASRRAAGETVRATHFHNRLTKAWLGGATIDAVILVDGLTDDEAWAVEIAEIALRDGLWNWTPGGEGRSSADLKRQWETDPELRTRHAAAMAKIQADPVIQERKVKALREALSTVENSERARVHAKRLWDDPVTRLKIVESLKSWSATPEEQARKSVMAKKLWADPDYKERRAAINRTPEVKAKRSKAMILATTESWKDEDTREKRRSGISAAAKKRYANSLVQQILAFISGAVDGATYVDISQALGVDRKKLIPGINRLCKQHLIEDRSGGRNGRFYRTNMDVNAAIPNRKIPSGADRSASLKTAWERRTAENDAKVLAFIDEKNPSMKDLKAMFGRKVMGWITKLIERGLVERRGGYHNCNFYRTNILQMETA